MKAGCRLFFVLFLFFLIHPVTAADLYVAINGSDGAHTAWSSAYTNIQDALNAATNGDTIYLAGHTFFLTNQLVWAAKTNVAIRGGYPAANDGETPGTPDPLLWPTIITHAAAYSNRLMLVTNVTTGTLENVTLTGGYQANAGNVYGGGLYIIGSTGLLLSACNITSNVLAGNNTSVFGGGLYANSCVMTISNCSVRGNTAGTTYNAVSANGGGMFVDGGTVTVRDTTFANNRTSGSNTGNRYGGGFYGNNATCLLRNCLVFANSADGLNGDGLYLSGGALTVENCTVSFNAGQGLKRNSGTAMVTNSIFWGNGDDLVGTIAVGWSDIENGDSNGVNGCISADALFERGFYLATNSPCVDTGTNDASVWGLTNYTIRVDGSNDSGRVDMGYHFPTGFNTNGTRDVYVAPSGMDVGHTGTNWADAYRTITKALSIACDGTRIYVESGIYDTASGESFPLRIDNLANVQILGTNPATTVIDAAGSNSRVLTMNYCGNVTVSDVMLTGGYQNKNNPDNFGGGVAVSYCGGVVFSGCLISRNTVDPTGMDSCYGGGLYARSSVLSLTDCLINSNTTITSANANQSCGAGLYLQTCVLTLRDSVITSNKCIGSNSLPGRYGGGVYNSGGICELRNCLVAANSVGGCVGDGIYQDGTASGVLTLENCTIAYNNNGYGIYRAGGTAAVSNSIIWGHGTDILGGATLAYCDTQSGLSNNLYGCVSYDPLFVDTNYFHLQSKQGHYIGGYLNGGSWSTSLSNSPVVDAGSSDADYSREPIPNGNRVNMGYAGNTLTASLTDTTTVFALAAVTNLGATQIGHRSVRLNGQVTDTGGQFPDCQFFYWVVDSAVTSSAPMGLSDSSFFKDIQGLGPGSNYQFAIIASNSAGSVWSDTQAFSTHGIPADFYVATNGDDTTGASWSTAYANPLTVFGIMEQGDTVYLAGHPFPIVEQLVWMATASQVRVTGGFAATNVADHPGPSDPTLWPTVLTRSATVTNRILFITNVVAGILEQVTIAGGYQTAAGNLYGGGVLIVGATNFIFSGCIISHNAVVANNVNVYGGGIYSKSSFVTISNCLVLSNSVNTSLNACYPYGGGLYVDGGRMTILNSTIASNKCSGSNIAFSRFGGGIYNYNGICLLRNGLLTANTVLTGTGDGFTSAGASAVSVFENCTVVSNVGQGVYRIAGSIFATNSIFWENGDDLTGTMSVAYCNIQSANDPFWADGINGCISADPIFTNPHAADYNLSRGSPCINVGANQGWMVKTLDLGGNPRVLSGAVDLGAYEYPAPAPAIFIEIR